MKTQSRFTFIKKPAMLISLLATMAFVLAACQAAAKPTSTQVPAAPKPTAITAPIATSTTAAFTEPTIAVTTDPKLGQFLVDGKGMTLYLFTKDEPGKSNCNAGCLAKWPPLLTQGHPVAGMGVDASLLGATTLADGRMIVTYNKAPLYYFVKDAKTGDTTGQGVQGVWFVISPDGKVVSK